MANSVFWSSALNAAMPGLTKMADRMHANRERDWYAQEMQKIMGSVPMLGNYQTPGINPNAQQGELLGNYVGINPDGSMFSPVPQQPQTGVLGNFQQPQMTMQQPQQGVFASNPAINPIEAQRQKEMQAQKARQEAMLKFQQGLIPMMMRGDTGVALAKQAMSMFGTQFAQEGVSGLKEAGRLVSGISRMADTRPEMAQSYLQSAIQYASPAARPILESIRPDMIASDSAAISASLYEGGGIGEMLLKSSVETGDKLLTQSHKGGIDAALQGQKHADDMALEGARRITKTSGQYSPTSDIKNYEYAVRQGYDKSFEEWKNTMGGAGSKKEQLELLKLQAQITGLNQEQEAKKAKLEGDLQKKDSAKNMQLTAIDSVLEEIEHAQDIASDGFAATGWAGKLSEAIPATPAYKLNRVVDTVKANLGFDKLQQMRDASPTGGALGQVSERELGFLQGTVASLDPGMGKEELQKKLAKVERHYRNWAMTLGGKNPDDKSQKTKLRFTASGELIQ